VHVCLGTSLFLLLFLPFFSFQQFFFCYTYFAHQQSILFCSCRTNLKLIMNKHHLHTILHSYVGYSDCISPWLTNSLMNFPVGSEFNCENTLSAAVKESFMVNTFKKANWHWVWYIILASTIPELAASSLMLISQIVYRIIFSTILWFVHYVPLQKVS